MYTELLPRPPNNAFCDIAEIKFKMNQQSRSNKEPKCPNAKEHKKRGPDCVRRSSLTSKYSPILSLNQMRFGQSTSVFIQASMRWTPTSARRLPQQKQRDDCALAAPGFSLQAGNSVRKEVLHHSRAMAPHRQRLQLLLAPACNENVKHVCGKRAAKTTAPFARTLHWST